MILSPVASVELLGTPLKVGPIALRFLLLTGAEPVETLRQRCLQGQHHVTLVEMRDKIGIGIGRSTRWTLLGELKQRGVQLPNGTHARRITEQGVWIQRDDEEQLLPADSVVLAVGAEGSPWLQEALGQSATVRLIGDASDPRRAFDAIHEGFEAAMSV